MDITRRRLLLRGLCACGSTFATAAWGQSTIDLHDEGRCFFDSAMSQESASAVKNGLFRQTSGDPRRDQVISNMLFRTARVFGLTRTQLPTFRFIPVTVKGDGFATDDLVESNTQGLVALNLRLLSGSTSDALSMTGFAVILAHEFAHIFQLRNRYVERFQINGYHTREIELHADYLAGWCISQQGGVATGLLESVANTLFSRGDNSPDVKEHHGTKVDRMNAVLKGYLSGGATDVVAAAAVNGMAYLDSL